MLLKHLELESSKFGGLLLFSVRVRQNGAGGIQMPVHRCFDHYFHAAHLSTSRGCCLQVVVASYAEDEIQNRYYLTPFPVKAAHDFPGRSFSSNLAGLFYTKSRS